MSNSLLNETCDIDQGQEEDLLFNDYKETLCKNISNFFNREAFVNVTLVCNGETIRAHQVILSACSPFFENILISLSEPNPTVVFTDIPKSEMVFLLEYMYKGHVSVPKSLVPSLLKTAKKLQIQGLDHYVDNSQINSKSMGRDDVGTQSSPRISLGTPEPKVDVPTEDQNTSVPVLTGLCNEEVPRWLSVNRSPRKKNGHRETVLNPFAKSRGHSDSDSTQFDFDPGPSKSSFEKESPLKASTSINTDSDVEFVDNDPFVVVIADTQNKKTSEIPVRKRRHRANFQLNEENFSSDDNDLVSSKTKKSKNKFIDNNSANSEMLPNVKVNPIALRNKSGNRDDKPLREHSSCSNISKDEKLNPLSRDVSGDINHLKKNRNGDSNPLSRCIGKESNQNQDVSFESTSTAVPSPPTAKEDCSTGQKKISKETLKDFCRTSVQQLTNFCIVCQKSRTDCKEHILRRHQISNKKKLVSCQICSKKFTFENILELHKCQSQVKK